MPFDGPIGEEAWLAAAPDGPVEMPAAVKLIVGGRIARCVWRNALGGLTFEIPGSAQYLKWAPAGSGLRLLDEATRLRWVRSFTPVPEVLDAGTADDGSTWLLTAKVSGTTAVDERLKASPRIAVRAIGEGLRAFHEAVPTSGCPFDWSAQRRVERARRIANAGEMHPESWHPSHRDLGVDEALALVAEPPPVERLVVCHGDACAPNTLIDSTGRWTAHVDLGSTGTADLWSDLAVATWSTQWNYGPHWEEELLDAYGIQHDAERTRFYRLLWDLVD
ncbi:MAG TPA: aminoglycoside 3'-phosphotransferase [Acidimicrobiia bacterium]|nr:aminoglycoside 3'-phosphotransferase [Acidimicrobiia bacterium]